MAAAPNPFTLVFDALWTMPEAHPLFLNLVKVGNRVKFNKQENRDPLKQEIAVGDLPEVTLVSDSLSAVLYNTSSTSMCKRQYTWILATGDFRICELLFQIEWALFVSMLGWKEKLCALEWNSERFVKRADITTVTNGQSDRERNRGINGWSAIWRCEVEMHFKTSDLKSELT
jgi:hypothetical protein